MCLLVGNMSNVDVDVDVNYWESLKKTKKTSSSVNLADSFLIKKSIYRDTYHVPIKSIPKQYFDGPNKRYFVAYFLTGFVCENIYCYLLFNPQNCICYFRTPSRHLLWDNSRKILLFQLINQINDCQHNFNDIFETTFEFQSLRLCFTRESFATPCRPLIFDSFYFFYNAKRKVIKNLTIHFFIASLWFKRKMKQYWFANFMIYIMIYIWNTKEYPYCHFVDW